MTTQDVVREFFNTWIPREGTVEERAESLAARLREEDIAAVINLIEAIADSSDPNTSLIAAQYGLAHMGWLRGEQAKAARQNATKADEPVIGARGRSRER